MNKSKNINDNSQKFHEFMLNSDKCITKKQKRKWEKYYFALTTLIPEKQLLSVCNMFGGIYKVRNSSQHVNVLANLFGIEPIMIITRIDLIKKALEADDIKEKTIRR
ncbi:MAG: hypothetical protein IJO32_02795 [Bacilli bacterium]|nr:hypothetical protein [Bacilli bacterium]